MFLFRSEIDLEGAGCGDAIIGTPFGLRLDLLMDVVCCWTDMICCFATKLEMKWYKIWSFGFVTFFLVRSAIFAKNLSFTFWIISTTSKLEIYFEIWTHDIVFEKMNLILVVKILIVYDNSNQHSYLKSILFKKILTKSVDPKIHKNSPHDLCKQKGFEIKTI